MNSDEPRVESGHEPAQNVELPVAAILAIEAEQRGIISAGQAQELNDLRDELESESSHDSYQSVEEVDTP
jgi:hypothetical protein